jgi:hypothetical protein
MTTENMPEAWQDLIRALTILARGQVNPVSPLHCQHDELFASADPEKFSAEELQELDRLGFFVTERDGEKLFLSFRFGSA